MNYLELSLHIEQQIVRLISISETTKYYALIHHTKFEESLNTFNRIINEESLWIDAYHPFLTTSEALSSYYLFIEQLKNNPLVVIKYGDILYYINSLQLLLHKQLLRIKKHSHF